MAESLLSQHRLSSVDLHGLTETISASIQDANSLLHSFESRLLAAQEQQRHLEAVRADLEAQLAQNDQDLNATSLEIQESEQAMLDWEERLRILKAVEMEMEETKDRALEELKTSVGKIPPEAGLYSLRSLTD
jgi:septal ring factor EnvC (AmiA/AmiB activator)